MARCLVYNFSGELDDISHLFPNDRLARIAAILDRHNIDVTLIDRANFRDLSIFGSAYMENLGRLSYQETNPLYEEKLETEAATLLGGDFDAIYLNLWHGTGFKFTMDLAARLKHANPALRIYGIGQKVDWFKGHILSLTSNTLDGLITGLGYNTIEALASGVPLIECPNAIAMQDGRPVETDRAILDVDKYPSGLYVPEIYRNIADKLPIHTLSLSNQACPNHCVFCIRPENYGSVNVRRTTSSVLEEMRIAFHQRQICRFRFEDSTPPVHALTDLAREILHSELAGKIKFSAFARVDTNAVEDFSLLQAAGCVALFFGGESLDDDNLHRLRKGTTYAAIRDTVGRAHAAGIHTVSNFIIPIPGDTAESLERTFTRLAECRDIFDSFLTLPAGVYPPTEWGQHPERHGIILDDDYLEKLVTYPIRYLFPLRMWPRLPYRYAIMGTPAAEVDPSDIFAVHDQFAQRVRNELGLFPIPDYIYLITDLLQVDAEQATRLLVSLMVRRDYQALKSHLQRGDSQ